MIGIDGGGTSTRCVAATLTGEIVGRGHGAGANVLTSADPGGSLRAALRAALAGTPPARVAGGVFALAGADSVRERAEALAEAAWADCGLPGRPAVVSDLAAAFSGATEEPSGAVLIAGTGAVGAKIVDREVTRRIDGHGWILGDAGSGVWIGRHAVQAVLASLEGRAAGTELLTAVATLPGAPADPTTGQIIALVHAGLDTSGPAWLGRLAPAVETAARAGDTAALGIVEEAARHLVATAHAVGLGTGPLVLAGSLLTEPTLLAAEVRAYLPDTPTLPARDSAAGAAALALHTFGAAASAHRRLIG
ncbi:N-acetylglucosamine kinase [Sinosporangium siamense]|uniref:N-acetylglucosamine kinase n=1 Tax=Sinosporangium siamense TaxID=1367973 RepID=A0A919V624_9ACTN|nr:N-acetylglucosamine kinase [Sinosporangium siamense]